MSEKSTAVQPAKEAAAIKLLADGGLFERIDELSESIAHRAFQIFEHRGRTHGHDLEDWFGAESELLHPLHLRVTESAEAVAVQAEVPGFTAKDLEITLQPHRLVLSGQRESNKENTTSEAIYREHCSSQIFRVVDLPAEVDSSKVRVTLKDGVLELVMPKVAVAERAPVAVPKAPIA